MASKKTGKNLVKTKRAENKQTKRANEGNQAKHVRLNAANPVTIAAALIAGAVITYVVLTAIYANDIALSNSIKQAMGPDYLARGAPSVKLNCTGATCRAAATVPTRTSTTPLRPTASPSTPPTVLTLCPSGVRADPLPFHGYSQLSDCFASGVAGQPIYFNEIGTYANGTAFINISQDTQSRIITTRAPITWNGLNVQLNGVTYGMQQMPIAEITVSRS